MDRYSIYKDRLSSLDSAKQFKFNFLYSLASVHSDNRMTDFIEPYLMRRRVALFRNNSFESFENEELSRANEEIANVSLKGALMKISSELGEIENEIVEAVSKNNYTQKIDHESNMIFVFAAIFFEAHLEDYLDLNLGDNLVIPFEGDFDIKILIDFDKVIELLARYKWYVWLLNTTKGKILDSKSKIKSKKQNQKLTFNKLFRAEYRDKIPNEVIRFLGPGEADAWIYKEGKKDWTYEGPESAIIIPFYALIDMGYIVKPPHREKKDFITVWLNEFGKEYKAKTFDRSPMDYKSNEYFTEYLNKLEK
jgi:hypothetical protein